MNPLLRLITSGMILFLSMDHILAAAIIGADRSERPPFTSLHANALQHATIIKMEHSRSSNKEKTKKMTTNNQSRIVLLRGGGGGPLQRFSHHVTSSKKLSWMLLITSILIETTATSLSKYSRDTGSRPLFMLACCIYIVCMSGFNLSVAQIEVGAAYAVWSALGTCVVTAMGIAFFGESCNPAKLSCIALIITGVVGLNLIC